MQELGSLCQVGQYLCIFPALSAGPGKEGRFNLRCDKAGGEMSWLDSILESHLLEEITWA